MKWFLNTCRGRRASISLLASGALPERDRVEIERHVAACAECRNRYDELKTLLAPTNDWERQFDHIEPSEAAKRRWVAAIRNSSKPTSPPAKLPGIILVGVWREIVLPCRAIWAGLAAAWLLISIVNLSVRSHVQMAMAKSASTQEMVMTWRQQERVLAELIGPTEMRAVPPPKAPVPQPRSERRRELLMV
jgi:anti-sigma factor RsiW